MHYARLVNGAAWTDLLASRASKKWASLVVLALVIAVGLAVAFAAAKVHTQNAAANSAGLPVNMALPISLVAGKPDSVTVPDDVQRMLGIRRGGKEQIALATRPTRMRPLAMPGSTALDPAGLVRIRVRFAPAEVVEIGQIDDPCASPGSNRPMRRELHAGDRVHKGDLLAVLYSIDLGNKKNDLFDALSQLQLDAEVLKKAERYKEAVPEIYLLNSQRNVQADLNAVNRAENTLKTWEIPENEIHAVRDEVKRVATEQDRRAKASELLKQWARVELPPEDGYLIEQNVALHETVVDNTTNLFQIARVDPLIVLAAAPEDDLPALQALKLRTRNQMQWKVSTVGSKPIAGFIDDIGYLIDPNQHTAVIRGHIPNPKGQLRQGNSSQPSSICRRRRMSSKCRSAH